MKLAALLTCSCLVQPRSLAPCSAASSVCSGHPCISASTEQAKGHDIRHQTPPHKRTTKHTLILQISYYTAVALQY